MQTKNLTVSTWSDWFWGTCIVCIWSVSLLILGFRYALTSWLVEVALTWTRHWPQEAQVVLGRSSMWTPSPASVCRHGSTFPHRSNPHASAARTFSIVVVLLQASQFGYTDQICPFTMADRRWPRVLRDCLVRTCNGLLDVGELEEYSKIRTWLRSTWMHPVQLQSSWENCTWEQSEKMKGRPDRIHEAHDGTRWFAFDRCGSSVTWYSWYSKFLYRESYKVPANGKAGEVRVYLRSRKQICWTDVERTYINFVRVPRANLKA